jgi:hypothetical protein
MNNPQIRSISASNPIEMHCVIIGSVLGDSEFFPITTLNEGSAMFRKFVEHHGLGARDAGHCQIWHKNEIVAHVSYNGKVWPGAHWQRDATPLYEPQMS